MVLYGPVWSCMVLYGSVWSCKDLYGPVWSSVWSCMVLYGPCVRQRMGVSTTQRQCGISNQQGVNSKATKFWKKGISTKATCYRQLTQPSSTISKPGLNLHMRPPRTAHHRHHIARPLPPAHARPVRHSAITRMHTCPAAAHRAASAATHSTHSRISW